jgi:uroporphyrin-III C-methyltransferase/precorrin-2 dehydrogenase/sirohydrochlorin ferrochelatase
MQATKPLATATAHAAAPRAAAAHLSLAIRADDWPCLVVGGGRVGSRKAATLLRAGAKVAVLSPEISPRLRAMVEGGRLEWRKRRYAPAELRGFRLAVAATADRALNLRIGRDAEKKGILSCVASSGARSRVIFPAVHETQDVVVAVHSRGRDCRRSQSVRNRIALWLSASRQLRTARSAADLALDGQPSARGKSHRGIGRVYIVGAGPGAADLITVRGYHALRAADAILMDELLPADFLAELGIPTADKRLERLGGGGRHWSQEEINQWLVAAAISGQTVVRLKGGDPFVFGRGDSEIDALAKHDIPWEVIPGPSSATAALSGAGLPLTRHAKGRSFAVATARVEGGQVSETFPRADSLAILMGVTVLDQVVSRLLADGWPPDAPAAIVERGTMPWERRVSGSLGLLSELARQAHVASPAIVVVGEAAASIAAFRRRPTIIHTGLDAANFSMLGNVLHWPAQAILPRAEGRRLLPHALRAIRRGNIDWIVFTDKFAVGSFVTALDAERQDARLLGSLRIAAVGTQTLRRLERHNLWADAVLMEDDEKLLAPFERGGGGEDIALGDLRQQGVLVIQGSHAPRGLCRRLENAGAVVSRLVLDRLAPHPELGRPLPDHDVIYFVSPAGVRAYARTYGSSAFQREAWCLGEATRRALAAYGVEATVVRPQQPLLPCPARARVKC